MAGGPNVVSLPYGQPGPTDQPCRGTLVGCPKGSQRVGARVFDEGLAFGGVL